MAKKGKGYFNGNMIWILNLIFAIIPFTSWLFGGITRIMRKHVVAGILQFIPPFTVVFWVVDIITVATTKDLQLFA